MFLIADSGSTKTDWRLVLPDKKILNFQSPGINPFFQHSEEIKDSLKALQEAWKDYLDLELTIYYYGAGCATAAKQDIIKQVLLQLFKHANIWVNSDLLGAARALCNKEPGIVCILGTGSNACYYDGEEIAKTIPSFGYIFGDYGSGAHIGKSLIQSYFDGLLPEEVKRNFEARSGNTREQILENVYKKAFPNRFLASYSLFVFQNRENAFCSGLLKSCFLQFFNRQVLCFEEARTQPVHLVGSVAYYYNQYIKVAAAESGLQLGNILPAPIAALSLFHQENA